MLNKATWGMLNDTEKTLLREVEPKRLEKLDEDGLSELHDRIRRARRKYTKLYRRRAAEQVIEDGSRKKAHAQHARTVAKAEAFEDALAVVSRELAKAARSSAKALKEERLDLARASKGKGFGSKAGKSKSKSKSESESESESKSKGKGKSKAATPKQKAKGKEKTPNSKKSVASQRSSKARSVAAGDSL